MNECNSGPSMCQSRWSEFPRGRVPQRTVEHVPVPQQTVEQIADAPQFTEGTVEGGGWSRERVQQRIDKQRWGCPFHNLGKRSLRCVWYHKRECNGSTSNLWKCLSHKIRLWCSERLATRQIILKASVPVIYRSSLCEDDAIFLSFFC